MAAGSARAALLVERNFKNVLLDSTYYPHCVRRRTIGRAYKRAQISQLFSKQGTTIRVLYSAETSCGELTKVITPQLEFSKMDQKESFKPPCMTRGGTDPILVICPKFPELGSVLGVPKLG
jgi:hypothetical protein